MRVAVYQCRSGTADVAGNLSRIGEAARRAADGGAALLVCPEMMLSGYNLGPDRIRALAEAANGPSAGRIAEIATAAGLAIVYGYPECADGVIYNAAQLIDRGGSTRLNYRKTHLFGHAERDAFTAGSELGRVSELDGWKVALLICYDVEFPEAVRLLSLAGADLVLVPTALMHPYERLPGVLIPARAYENQLYVVYANYCGSEGELSYCGSSVIAAPDGRCLVHAGVDEELRVADVTLDALGASRRINTYFADRRPALYAGLVSTPRTP